MHILWDEIQESGEHGEIYSSDDIRLPLLGIRYLESATMPMSEDYVYLTDSETLLQVLDNSSRLSFICIGNIAQSFLDDQGWAAIVLPEATNPHTLFITVQEIFEKYIQWEQDMLLAIAEDEPLQSIFDCGVRFLKNPIALFDPTFAFIMMAGILPENIENTIWEDVLSKGYSRIENFPIEEQRMLEKRLSEQEEPFIYETKGKYSNAQQITAALIHEGTHLGNFGGTDINAPFTLGQLSITVYLKKYMELALSTDKQFNSIAEGTGYFVERLLQGLSVEPNTIAFHLRNRSWRIDDSYCLYFISRADNSQIDDNLYDAYIYRFHELFPDAMIFPYENGVLVINHNNDQIRTDTHFTNELSQLLHNLNFRCGVSLVIFNFMNLKYAYIQCKTALTSPSPNTTDNIHLFETNYSEYIMNALGASTSLKSLCHPKIFELLAAESGKGPEFVHTLQTYLVNGRNKTLTAEKLFIHRNTLLYRLGRIEDLLEIDIEKTDDETLFILLMSCSIVTYLNDITKNS